jgi:hypothetical protein
MYLSKMDRAIGQSNTGDPLALAPPAASIDLPQSRPLTDSGSDGERLNI